MSLFESLFTAVSGLTAQSQSLSMISNNIANASTVGYKGVEASFSSLVTTANSAVLYSPGGVNVKQNNLIDQQGVLQQTSSATDVAITGNGFFVVKSDAGGSSAEPVYTRAGSFTENASGVLENTAGFDLMGWPLGANNTLPSNSADIASLVPVNVAFVGGLTQPTSTASLDANLNSTQADFAVAGIPTYPIPPGTTPSFTQTITVYDFLGAAQNLSVSFTKEESPTAIARGVGTSYATNTAPLAGQTVNADTFASGNSFSVTVPGSVPVGPSVITIGATTSIADVMTQLNDIVDGNNHQLVSASLDPNGHLVIKAANTGAALTLANVSGTPLAGLGLVAGANAAPAFSAANMLTGSLPPSTPDTEGWWNVQYTTPDGAVVSSGSINFSGNGQLNSTPNGTGQDLVNLQNIDWGNGSAKQNIAFDISGLTQFSGDFNVISSNQNGAALGLRTGISIDSDGFVSAQFSNGQSTKIYKLPVATFADPDGLDSLSGNVFQQSDASGALNLREAGKGSAGTITGGALEASTVDLADEFSQMIVTQQAYSANTKVISTADQMLQTLLQLQT